nr:MAG TPA: hypothetical protein [Caudoviricetes sp.]
MIHILSSIHINIISMRRSFDTIIFYTHRYIIVIIQSLF